MRPVERGGCVYILTNRPHGVLYIGVTSDLLSRIGEHREGEYQGAFTTQYRVHKLVYYEVHGTIEEAIAREKQLKGGSRGKKIELIERINPMWKDLYPDLLKREEEPEPLVALPRQTP